MSRLLGGFSRQHMQKVNQKCHTVKTERSAQTSSSQTNIMIFRSLLTFFTQKCCLTLQNPIWKSTIYFYLDSALDPPVFYCRLYLAKAFRFVFVDSVSKDSFAKSFFSPDWAIFRRELPVNY